MWNSSVLQIKSSLHLLFSLLPVAALLLFFRHVCKWYCSTFFWLPFCSIVASVVNACLAAFAAYSCSIAVFHFLHHPCKYCHIPPDAVRQYCGSNSLLHTLWYLWSLLPMHYIWHFLHHVCNTVVFRLDTACHIAVSESINGNIFSLIVAAASAVSAWCAHI